MAITNPTFRADGGGTVQVALSDASTALSSLCVSSQISKWAKCKPFRNSARSFASASARSSARAAANYGIACPASTTDYATALAGQYTYNRPRGYSQGEPYRLMDFLGYLHGVTAPVRNFQGAEVTLPYSSVNITFLTSISGTDYVIGLDDISGLSAMYLAIVMSKDNWSTVYIATSQTTLGNGANQITLTSAAPLGVPGTWEMKAVACSVRGTSGRLTLITDESFQLARYMALPFEDVSYNTATLIINAYAVCNVGIGYITYTSISSWKIPSTINLTQAYTSAVTVTYTGIQVTHEGEITTYNLSSSRAYTIRVGSTTPFLTPADLVQGDFSVWPYLYSGDRVKIIATISPSEIELGLRSALIP